MDNAVVDLTDTEATSLPAGSQIQLDSQRLADDLKRQIAEKKKEVDIARDAFRQRSKELKDLELTLESVHSQASKKQEDWQGRFPWSEKAETLLRTTFMLSTFRPLQIEIINAALSGRDVLVILPTGGGKSLVYQLPALLTDGFALVVSPLISLMHDQVRQLRAIGVRAELLCSETAAEEVKGTYQAMLDASAGLRLLYVTPERLVKSKTLMSKLERAHGAGRLSRAVVDEAHCISQWGHDWRQDYTRLGLIKTQFRGVPLMALTATATPRVQQDVKGSLGMELCEMFRASVDRPNLRYEVRLKPAGAEEAMAALADVIVQRFRGESGIVYCFSKKEAEAVAAYLQGRGVKARFFHSELEMVAQAGSGRSGRLQVHEDWASGRLQVVVATIAFGMGINMLTCRFVVHHSMSKSLSAYYQEAGRAGRDGEPATCLMYYKPGDVTRLSTLTVANQDYPRVQDLYELVKYCEALLAAPSADEMHRQGRERIAAFFGESLALPRPAPAAGAAAAAAELRDVTELAQIPLAIAERLGGEGKEPTLVQLTDMWAGAGRRGAACLADVPTAPKGFSKGRLERLLVLLVVEGVLAQKFRFSPYAVNSYIEPGPHAAAVRAGSRRVRVTLAGDDDFPAAAAAAAAGKPAGRRPRSAPAAGGAAAGRKRGKKRRGTSEEEEEEEEAAEAAEAEAEEGEGRGGEEEEDCDFVETTPKARPARPKAKAPPDDSD